MDTAEQLPIFKEFFEKYYLSKIIENVRTEKNRVTIDYNDIAKFNPELAMDILEKPEETLKSAEISINSLGYDKVKLRIRGELPDRKIRIRDLKSEHLGKFITVEGTIESKSDKWINISSAVFKCLCGESINILQNESELKEPTKCICGKKNSFHISSKEIVDGFTIRMQELTSKIKYGSQLAVKSVMCRDDLTDTIIEEKLIEGMKVEINGIYKERTSNKGGRKQTELIAYIEANYIKISEETFYDVELTPEDIEEIKEFSKRPNLIADIANGLFQGVHGYYKIKEALTLQAFGGISDYETIPNTRGHIHILLVGDPGENKSAFLEYANNFNPKSVLVVGKSVSAVGLSGAVIRDELTGSYMLKPGAIPLANNGILLADEIDKMKPEDRDILHQPMENQKLSITKANITDRTLLARESFLISMNPKNGYFNNQDMNYQQIDLPPTLINRFDLVFVMKKNRIKSEEVRKFEKEKAKIMMTRNDPESQKKLIAFHKFMRKYIAYARQQVFPKFDKYLSEEYLPEKYASFDYERKNNDANGKTDFPITPRHLNIIRRLAEARRRIFLDEKVTIEDADYAIEKIKGSLQDIATDMETGKLDTEWVSDSVGGKLKQLVESFNDVFDKLKMNDGNVLIDDLYKSLEEKGFKLSEIESFVEKKKKYGDIYSPRNHLVRRC